MTRRSAIAIAVLSSILSSLGWIFQGNAVHAIGPMTVVCAQGLLAGLYYLFYIRSPSKRIPLALIQTHWKKLAEFTLLRGIVGGILVCYALTLSESIKTMFFTKLEPYFVLFWAWLLQNQRITRDHALLLAIHVSGAILLSTGGQFSLAQSQWGDLLLISAVGIFSYTYIHAGDLSKTLGASHVNGLSSIATGLATLPAALLLAPAEAWNLYSVGWLNLIVVVALFNIFALTMWFSALRHLENWLVSALRAVGPVFAAPIAWACFNQSLTLSQIFGAGIVLVTSGMLARKKFA